MRPSISIDLFSDFVCPWCFIGSTRLEQVLAELSSEVEAEVCYHPFFLDPSVPAAGRSVPDMLRQKYGVEPKQVWARAEAAAAQSGIALDLSVQPMMYRTEKAHTLLRHAFAKGTQRALAADLFRRYFLDAQNIDDVDTLAAIAEPHGFSRSEAKELCGAPSELELTREEASAAVQGGIRGVPLFVFDGRLAVSGAQATTVLVAAIHKALETRSESPASEAG
jgi:predicted DsbA family dithiol-disulfide isomerase